MRKDPLITGEYYHIFNRGVDKRLIFLEKNDVDRFVQSMVEFNTVEPIGSLYEHAFGERYTSPSNKQLVDIICYCLNPNHFHLLLRQKVDNGISEYMKRLGGGYTNYFNEKNKRSGALFQGTFKSVHISSNEQLLHVSCYINLNYCVHNIHNLEHTFVRSSWNEFTSHRKEICKPEIILKQFKYPTIYKKVAIDTIEQIVLQRHQGMVDEKQNLYIE